MEEQAILHNQFTPTLCLAGEEPYQLISAITMLVPFLMMAA
jgi:hypothetical protein